MYILSLLNPSFLSPSSLPPSLLLSLCLPPSLPPPPSSLPPSSPAEHEIPETLTLQVVCSGQIVAQTEFTYYANSQYNSDLLFQYLVQNFPSYFPEAGMDGSMGGQGGGAGGSAGGGGGGGGGGGAGYYNYGNIPPNSFNLLLGSCRLGIEELVKATLQLPAMTAITTEQVRITGVFKILLQVLLQVYYEILRIY